ncbi:MAG: Ku protein [Candidatus Kaiserbacteria bacterium]|nr:Ku protein [Candidatus Kaiserbacteria bacterium]
MRALWTGSISFGLVNIPVRLYSGSAERALSFHLFDKKDMCPVSYQKVCREDDRTIDAKDIVKGYEVEKGEYVVLENEDFKRANARKTETIDIVQFVDLSQIHPKYFDKPYYLEPDKKSAKAYCLLRDALKESGKAGIADYVLRDKEKIGALTVEDDVIMLIQLRFQDEIRDHEDLNAPKEGKYSKKELSMALSLVKELSGRFDPKKFKDTYTDELMKVINAKAKGTLKKGSVKSPIQPTDVEDIMSALKRSLEESADKGARVHAKRR